jgi:ribonucleoside-diphosphate reductase alpha chain
VALYRDGSKLSQPLNSQSDEEGEETDAENTKHETQNTKQEIQAAPAERLPEPVEKVIVKIVERPLRRRLPDTRASVTHKFDIAGHEGYITVGLFEDNTPGEVFITMAKQGSTIGGLMDTIATLISLNLQYGVPMDAIVRKFEHMRFEPSGMTTNQDIPFAKSFIDYVVRWMGMQFVSGYRAANAPKRESQMNLIEPSTAITPESGSGGMEASSGLSGREVVREASGEAAGHGGPSFSPANANGNGADSPSLVEPRTKYMHAVVGAKNPLNAAMEGLMGDAPSCSCGSITVRNGSCYKCLNCGASLGCS